MKEEAAFSAFLPKEKWDDSTAVASHHFLGILRSSSKANEKIAITPDMIGKLTENHVSVLVQRGVGKKWNFEDIEYADQGAELFDNAIDVIKQSSLILKVSNFTLDELALFSEGQTLISYTNFKQLRKKEVETIVAKKINALAYNLITDREGKVVVDNIVQQILGVNAREIAFSEFLLPILITLIFNRIRFAVQTNPAILQSIYCYGGILTHRELAEKFEMKWQDILLLCWNWN